jgi:hypothetical protein
VKPKQETRKSQIQSKKSTNLPSEIGDLLKEVRDGGISELAHLDKSVQARVVNWAQDVVNQYKSILKENPGKIKNSVDLPCPKEALKLAIKALLPAHVAKGSDEMVNFLKDSYVRLSAFQEISREDKNTVIKESHEMDPKLESTETSLFSNYHKYMQIIVSEQKILLDDINTFINDLKIC